MSILDTDYFLIEGGDGPRKIQASALKDGLTLDYSDFYMLTNTDTFSSGKVKCGDILDKLPAADSSTPYHLLLRTCI